jgi:hypothetical protein
MDIAESTRSGQSGGCCEMGKPVGILNRPCALPVCQSRSRWPRPPGPALALTCERPLASGPAARQGQTNVRTVAPGVKLPTSSGMRSVLKYAAAGVQACN